MLDNKPSKSQAATCLTFFSSGAGEKGYRKEFIFNELSFHRGRADLSIG